MSMLGLDPGNTNAGGIDYSSTSAGLWSFRGRIDRGSYWIRFIALWLFAGIGSLAIGFLAQGVQGGTAVLWFVLVVAFEAAVAWFGLATLVKRLHDVGRSGWQILIALAIPLVLLGIGIGVSYYRETSCNCTPAGDDLTPSIIALVTLASWLCIGILLGSVKAKPGPNKYGEGPQ